MDYITEVKGQFKLALKLRDNWRTRRSTICVIINKLQLLGLSGNFGETMANVRGHRCNYFTFDSIRSNP